MQKGAFLMSALTIEIPKQSDIKVRVRKCEETY
jgi:hypothetical protein